MAVSITWSATQNGTQVNDNLAAGDTGIDHGSNTNGTILAQREIWIRHDGTNPITNAGFYITQYSGTYGGANTAVADISELLAWGGGSTANAFGGFEINMNGGDANPSDWPIFSAKQPVNGSAFFAGVGDNSATKVSLKTTMGGSVTSVGTLLGGGATDAKFYSRIGIPDDENIIGIRQFDQKLRYTFTS